MPCDLVSFFFFFLVFAFVGFNRAGNPEETDETPAV